MIYRDFQGLRLSALGMGCMRLPVLNGQAGAVDEKAVESMVAYAMAHGVNYYDTAWGYHNGRSETVMGKALARYPRESYYLCTKFPGYDLSNMDKAEEIFEEQLRRTGAGYFDFYLCHNVFEMNIDAYLDPRHGILEHLLRQKDAGRIRHLGFSLHGGMDVMERFLDVYGAHMELCQIQLNYVDWDFQKAGEKVARLKAQGLPVWAMEPVRGGKLAQLKPEYEARLRALRPEESPAGWALRFLQTIPEVCVTLSGMSDMAQLKENIETFSGGEPLSPAETDVLLSVAEDMVKEQSVPCTGCQYCAPHCPQELPIPRLIELYNEHRFSGGGIIVTRKLNAIPEEKQPSHCIGCRSCESVCPQQIRISEVMNDYLKRLT